MESAIDTATEFEDEFLPDFEEGIAETTESPEIVDDFLNDFVDDFVSDFSVSVVAEKEEDEDEDTLIITEMQRQAIELGYSNVEYADYELLEKLIDRMSATSQAEIVGVGADQLANVKGTILELSTSQATLILQEDKNRVVEKHSAFSADHILGASTCQLIYGWLNNRVREEPEASIEQLYNDFINSRVVPSENYALKEHVLLSYFKTTVPYIKQRINSTITTMRSNLEQRERVASFLLDAELQLTEQLSNAVGNSIIRDIESKNGNYYTKCPKCGKQVVLDKPIFHMITFAAESGMGKKFFITPIFCECGENLMFTLDEYADMFKTYLLDNATNVKTYIEDAKKNSQGSVVLRTKVQISSVEKCIEHLITTEETKSFSEKEKRKQRTVSVNYSDFYRAVDNFYNKLVGMSPSCLLEENTPSTIHTIAANAKIVQGENGGYEVKRSDDAAFRGLTYHDIAVYVMQCLSKDYQAEKNKAIFSLIRELKSKSIGTKNIACDKLWDLQIKLAFLNRFKLIKNPRSLSREEVSELFWLIKTLEPEWEPTDRQDTAVILKKAIEMIPILKQEVVKSKQDHEDAVQSLKHWFRFLEFYPVIKVNAYSYSELSEFVCDVNVATILDEVADKMLLNTYACEFFEYWKGLRIVRAASLKNALVKEANLADVGARINNIFSDKLSPFTVNGIGKQTRERISAAYMRDMQSDQFISQISKTVLKCDYYQFCKLLLDLPEKLNGDAEVANIMYNLYVSLYHEMLRVVKKSREEFYFSDFTAEEINSCNQFKYLKFSRYIPIRLEGETAEQYCVRYEKLYANQSFIYAKCRNTAEMFKGIDFLMFILCSSVQDAGYTSRTITMFMSAIFEMAHYDCNPKGACCVLGISDMHYNIIQSKSHNLLYLPDSELLYKLHNSVYLTSVAEVIGKLQEDYDSCVVNVKSSPVSINNSIDVRNTVVDLMQMESYAVDTDGAAINDKEDVEMELASALGMSIDKLIDWAGCKI